MLKTRKSKFLLMATALGLCGFPACPVGVPSPGVPCNTLLVPKEATQSIKIMSANVGNSYKGIPGSSSYRSSYLYALRSEFRVYEDTLSENIARNKPDVIALQEVMSPLICDIGFESDPRKACYPDTPPSFSAARILGPDYSVVCDENRSIECIGVRNDFGQIQNPRQKSKHADHFEVYSDWLPQGFQYAYGGAVTASLGGDTCSWLDGGCTNDHSCDDESTVSAITVKQVNGEILRVVHVHPSAGKANACRKKQVKQGFELAKGFLRSVILGDWNFVPGGFSQPEVSAEFFEHVGLDREFVNHGACVDGVRWPTTATGLALDTVVSNFLSGSCVVLDSDGPGDFKRLDEGFTTEGFTAKEVAALESQRMDHSALSCLLYY